MGLSGSCALKEAGSAVDCDPDIHAGGVATIPCHFYGAQRDAVPPRDKLQRKVRFVDIDAECDMQQDTHDVPFRFSEDSDKVDVPEEFASDDPRDVNRLSGVGAMKED